MMQNDTMTMAQTGYHRLRCDALTRGPPSSLVRYAAETSRRNPGWYRRSFPESFKVVKVVHIVHSLGRLSMARLTTYALGWRSGDCRCRQHRGSQQPPPAGPARRQTARLWTSSFDSPARPPKGFDERRATRGGRQARVRLSSINRRHRARWRREPPPPHLAAARIDIGKSAAPGSKGQRKRTSLGGGGSDTSAVPTERPGKLRRLREPPARMGQPLAMAKAAPLRAARVVPPAETASETGAGGSAATRGQRPTRQLFRATVGGGNKRKRKVS